MKFDDVRQGLTYDDVLLVPQYSEVVGMQIDIKTHLTKNIVLNIPIVSAAMDTVTESKMAIALAREGGLGFIHKNMSIEDQAHEVDLVKKNESGMITNPIVLKGEHTVKEAAEIMANYKISGLPIVDDDNVLQGIITNRDIKYLKIDNTPVSKVMSKMPIVTAPQGTTLEEAKEILWDNRIEKITNCR